ncbi:MAG TPA: Clp protease N-terminal domain-containing protein [Gemmataceae bacterium]|nr:Clp protease N-terminal domain-containing protein [Gemmataceae bacterium]
MPTPEVPSDVFTPGGGIRLDLLTDPAGRALAEAIRLARETRWESVRSPHIFMGLLAVSDSGMATWGERLGADLPNLLGQFQELFHQDEADGEATLALNREFLSDNVIRLLRAAHARATYHKRNSITSMDLLITMLTANNSIVAECFQSIGVTAAKLTEMAVLAEQQMESRERKRSDNSR